MSTALRASLVLLISLAFFALAGFVYAQDDTDGNDACPSIPSIYVYVSGVKYGEKIGDKVNLYGKSCIDLENKQVAAKGHCVGPKNCKADLCGGKPCALPTGPLPSISDTSDVTGGQPPTSQTQQPAPTTNRSLLEQMIFDPTALSQQKPELSPSANSVEELLKQIDANSGLGGKVREEIGSFFSPTPLNPNQQSFQLQPRDQNGNLISQDVGPQNTMTNSDSTFAGNQEQETSQTSACDSWWSCMQERVSSAYGEALEEAAQKTTRKPFSALVPDGKGGYYLPSDARLTEAQGPPSRADADRVTGLDGPAEFKATFYTAQGTGSGEKFNGSGFASSLYPIGTAGTMEFLDKDGNVVATRQMYVNDWGNLGPGVGADLPRSTVAEVQVETGIKYVRDGVFDVRFTPEAVIQGKVAGDGWYADTAAAKAANSYVQARTGGYSPSDALAAVEQNTGAYAAYQPSDNTATPQTNVASNADVPLPRDNPFRSGGNIASVANTDLPSSAAITQQFLNDTNTRSIALAGEPANVASSQSPQFAAVEPPETNQVTGATVRVGENTAQVNPDGSVKVTINTANETSYVKTIPADVAQALTFTEMVQSVQNQVADMPKDQDRVISNPLVFVPDAQPEVSVTPEIAPPPPVGGVNTPDVPVASVEVPKVDTPQIPEAQIRERIGQSIPRDQYDKMTPLSQQLARDSAVQGIEFDQRTAQLAEERRLALAQQQAPAVTPTPSALTTLSNAANTVTDWGKNAWNWSSEKIASLLGSTPEPEAPIAAEVTTDESQRTVVQTEPVAPTAGTQIPEAPSPETQAAEDAQLAERLARADRETAAYRQQQAPSPSPVEDVPSGVGTVLPVTPAPAGQLSNAPRAEELDKINSVFQETITDARATLATAQATAQVTKDLFGDGATTDFVQDVGVKTAQQRLDDVQARYAEYVKYMNEGGSAPAWLQTAVETARVGESPVSRELGDFKNSTHEAAYDAARDFKKELKPDGSAWSMFTSGARWLGWTTASTLAGGVQTGGEMLGVPGFNPDENRALKQAVDPIGQGIGATFDVAVTTLPFASPVSRMTALGDRGVTAVADLVAGGVTRSGVEAADVFTTAGARIVAREAADIPVVIEQTAPRVVAEVPAVVEQTAPRVVADAATAPSREIGDIGLQAVERELAAARPAPTTAELQQTIDRIAADARAAASERPAVPPSEAPPTVSPEVQKIQDAIAEVRAASEKSPIIPSEVPASTAGVTPSPVLSSEERLANALADINRGVRPLETPTSVPGVIPTNTQLPGVKIQQWADDFAVPGRVVNDDIALIDAQAARASAQPAPRVAPEAERIGAATTQQAPRDITNQGLQNLERDLARAVDDVNIASRSEPNVGVKALEDVAANINAGLPTNVSPQVKALDDLVKTLETGAQEVRAGNAEVWSSERLAALRQNADLVAQKGQQELADRMRNAADGLAGEVRPLKQIPGSNTIFDVPLEQKSFFSRTGDNIQLAWNDLKNSASDAWSNLWGRTGQ